MPETNVESDCPAQRWYSSSQKHQSHSFKAKGYIPLLWGKLNALKTRLHPRLGLTWPTGKLTKFLSLLGCRIIRAPVWKFGNVDDACLWPPKLSLMGGEAGQLCSSQPSGVHAKDPRESVGLQDLSKEIKFKNLWLRQKLPDFYHPIYLIVTVTKFLRPSSPLPAPC